MSLARLVSCGSILLIVLVLAACSSNSPTQPGSDDSIEVDLSRFPETGDPVPNRTVLTDQWESIGILFDAEPVGVNLIMENFGGESKGIKMSIQGNFRVVEWRTHGDPGIAASLLAFEF